MNHIYNKHELLNPLLTNNFAILFELFDIMILFYLMIYYSLIKDYAISTIFGMIFIEHINQITYNYRHYPNTIINYTILFIEIIIFIYCIYKKYLKTAFIISIGVFIHTYQIIYNRNFVDIVSYKDILSLTICK